MYRQSRKHLCPFLYLPLSPHYLKVRYTQIHSLGQIFVQIYIDAIDAQTKYTEPRERFYSIHCVKICYLQVEGKRAESFEFYFYMALDCMPQKLLCQSVDNR